jgi:phage terminase small subunit
MARNDVLDPREQRFVELYVETSNGTRSALAAGFGRNYNTAGFQATQLLKRPKIKDAID